MYTRIYLKPDQREKFALIDKYFHSFVFLIEQITKIYLPVIKDMHNLRFGFFHL